MFEGESTAYRQIEGSSQVVRLSHLERVELQWLKYYSVATDTYNSLLTGTEFKSYHSADEELEVLPDDGRAEWDPPQDMTAKNTIWENTSYAPIFERTLHMNWLFKAKDPYAIRDIHHMFSSAKQFRAIVIYYRSNKIQQQTPAMIYQIQQFHEGLLQLLASTPTNPHPMFTSLLYFLPDISSLGSEPAQSYTTQFLRIWLQILTHLCYLHIPIVKAKNFHTKFALEPNGARVYSSREVLFAVLNNFAYIIKTSTTPVDTSIPPASQVSPILINVPVIRCCTITIAGIIACRVDPVDDMMLDRCRDLVFNIIKPNLTILSHLKPDVLAICDILEELFHMPISHFSSYVQHPEILAILHLRER